jgi:valyl-tRNA synthetase
LQGKKVSWIPGLDHAGIATQSVVERQLLQTRGLRRIEMGREAWDTAISTWTDESGGRIQRQMRRLGLALSWKETYFTLDPPRSSFVKDAFLQFWEAGLVYRHARPVHWCPFLQTTISDMEVRYEEVRSATKLALPGEPEGLEVGVLYLLAFPLVDAAGLKLERLELVIGTTRPETSDMDVALAVHPEDPRYRHLIGMRIWHPICNAFLPIIGDAELVAVQRGTGVVKVTPSCDPADYACALRHNLPVFDATSHKLLKSSTCKLDLKSEAHLASRATLRKVVLDKMAALGLYRGADRNHAMRVPLCSRSGDLLEYRMLPQWYLSFSEYFIYFRTAIYLFLFWISFYLLFKVFKVWPSC